MQSKKDCYVKDMVLFLSGQKGDSFLNVPCVAATPPMYRILFLHR